MAAENRVTLKHIAKELGVSATTVSRVLSGKARQFRIGRETEAAVQRLAAEMNFRPNRVARGLRLNRTESIGLVIPDVSNPFFAGIAKEVALGARDCGYSVIICDSQESEEREIESLELLRERGAEGVVLCPVGRSAEHLSTFAGKHWPMVLADRYFPGLPLPYVVSDNHAGAREAVDYLIDNGHNRIACVQGSRGTSPNEDRLQGYREALTAKQIEVDETLVVGDGFGEQNGYISTKLLLKSAPDITAIFAMSNLISLGVLRAIAEEGLRVPEDISVVSFDDQPYSAYLASPMTAVALRCSEMGRIAVKLLFDRIQSPDRAISGGILLPTSLVIRGSVRNLLATQTEGSRHRVCG